MGVMVEAEISNFLEQVPYVGAIAVAAIAVALLAHWLVFAVLQRVAARTSSVIDDSLVSHGRQPSRFIVAIVALMLVVPALDLSEDIASSVTRALTVALTAAVGWLAYSLTRTIDDVVAARYDLSAKDNLRAREIHTRVRVLQRVVAAIIVIVTAAVILMAIPAVRQIGVTLFASAGIAGIVAGFAARSVLSNLLAGIQLALAQPIRIDDVVIIEGEWGWIEEIRMTFVVVRVWDLRRLIVPLTYFIETPFQNWTRRSADILGTVFLYTDYTVPVERVRGKLREILEGSDLWDGEVWGLQVTNASDRTMELRALMGARNSSDAWDLRCRVREDLIAFLQREYPQALPRLRAELTGELTGELAGAPARRESGEQGEPA